MQCVGHSQCMTVKPSHNTTGWAPNCDDDSIVQVLQMTRAGLMMMSKST